MLLLPLAYSAVSAQGGGATSPARPVNQAQKDTTASRDSVSAKGLDLDKLLVADEEGDLLIEDKPVAPAKAVASDSAAAVQSSTMAEGEGESVKSADSVGRASARPSTPGRRGPPPSKRADSDTADVGPAIVEEGRTINFAQNLKEYKSPRVAMLLSLLVPGLGQAYSRSYIKASAFGAAEVAAIGVAVYLNSVAKSKKRDAYDFADKHFDVKRVMSYDSTLRDEFFVRNPDIDIKRDSIPLPYDRYFYDAAKDKSPNYYESIRGKNFTPGWDGYDLSLDEVLRVGREMLVVDTNITITGAGGNKYELYDNRNSSMFYYVKRIWPASDGEWLLGYSSYQAEYNAMMDKSNSYRDAVNYMFYVILLNHIASSIDAGFTARAYNARLLGEENSAWNRLSVEQRFVFTGSELSPGVALRLRF